MKLKLLVIFLLLSRLSFGLMMPKEKKIAIAVDKYQHGYYEEAVLILKFLSDDFFSRNPIQASDAYMVRTASYFRLANYRRFNESLVNWSGLIMRQSSDSMKLISRFKMAQLYLEVGNIKACDSILSLISPKQLPGISKDFEQLKAKLFLEQGEITEAEKLLNKVYPVRKSNLNADYKNLFTAFNSSKTCYSDLIFSKIKMFILKGQDDSASYLILSHKDWLTNNLHDDYHLRKLEIMAGDLETSRSNSYKAHDHFKKAYEWNGFMDLDVGEINLLADLIVLSDKLEYKDESEKMLRKLQMLSSVYAGKNEPFQFAYELAVCNMLLDNHQFSKAAARLEKFSVYKNLAPWNPTRLAFAKIESALLIYNPKANIISSFDSLILSSQSNLSPSHPFAANLILDKNYFKIHFGTSSKNIETDLTRFNDLFIAKGYGGEYLLEYYDLCRAYYNRTDNLKTSVGFAEKAYNYSLNFFEPDSERRLYYQAVYAKALLESGNYSEFHAPRKYVTDITWISIDEKRKFYMELSQISKLVGEKDETKSFLSDILGDIEESGKDNIYDKANLASYVAYNYFQTGNLSKAERLLDQSTQDKKSLLNDSSISFVDNLFFKSRLELAKGNYSESDKSLDQASAVISNTYGVKSLLYGEYLKERADYYIAIGDYKRANEFIDKSQQIVSEKLGKGNLRNVILMMMKAYILSENDPKQLEKANILSLYNQSLSILSASIGTENLFCMDVLKKYAQYHVKINNLNKADSLLSIAEKYWKKTLGNDNKELLDIYLLKGDIAYKKDAYTASDKYYQNVKDIAVSIYDKNNSSYTTAFARQARVAFMQHKTIEAMDIMEELLPIHLNSVAKNFSSLSFREKSKYWNSIKDEFEFYMFLVLSDKELANKYSKDVYNNIISTKAILLSNSIKIRENIMTSGDSSLIHLYTEWVDLKEYFIEVSGLTKAELEKQKIDLMSIELEIEKKEKLLSKKSELFKSEEAISKAKMKDIVSVLSENEYAIELVRYRKFYKEFTDTANYAALILGSGSASPEVVLFPNGNKLETQYLKYTRNAARHHVKDQISYGIFWAPIQRKIPEGATIYLSAEGAFNQFNLEMLPDSTGKFLLDKVQLVQVTNTKELLRSVYQKTKNKNETTSNIVLCGSPEFYLENHSAPHSISKLPGAAKEIADLTSLFKTNGITAIDRMYKDLTEDWVKGLVSPKIFHIATHGYYSEGTGSENNAMLNSGLLLAGAGDIIDEGSNVNAHDGILTAYEAMNLNFDNTEFVVLSACETGLGEVQVGEGVYGLQRSFLIAGAKSIVVSLYKVNDEVTQKLMNEMYSNWLKTANIRSSFVMAKQKIKQEYPDIPVYWGAFILIEGQPKLKGKSKALVAK